MSRCTGLSSLSAIERETIITFNDEEQLAHVWTAQRPRITQLKKNPSARLLEEGTHGRSAWAIFEIPKELVSFRSRRRKATKTSGQGFSISIPVLEHENEPNVDLASRPAPGIHLCFLAKTLRGDDGPRPSTATCDLLAG